MRVIFQTSDKNYRIVEYQDQNYNLDDLKGECYDPKVNPNVPDLKDQELAFEQMVASEGVFGYELQVWNGMPDQGWEPVDACWGFVGAYNEQIKSFNHYIVNEMKQTIVEMES